jgi:putative FmdB family regulatory protein
VPIYEFVCEACGRLTESMQKMSDPPPAACPECGAGPLARLVSRTTFQLKGGGWYSDLYGSPRKKGEPAGGGKAAPEGKKAEAGSAPAPAPKGGAPSGGTGEG